jgi:transcriptional regulator NrdR family protein
MAKFRCSACGSPNTDVMDSRPTAAFRIRRRRLCKCGNRFTTVEIPIEEFALLASFDGAVMAKLHRDARRVTATIDEIIRQRTMT